MNICFLMYPWDRVDPESDSTLRLLHECASRGHTVAITHKHNLTIRDSVAYAFCQVLQSGKKQKVSSNIPAFYRGAHLKKSMLPLAGFDAIIMRDNPPLDSDVLNFLDSVKNDTFIMNDLEGLRIASNKLYTASFNGKAREFIPATFVSKNKEYLQTVFHESPADRMIMKPLSGSGGQGVIVLEKRAAQNFSSLLDFYIDADNRSNYVILQEYVEGAEQGDVRVMMLNGEPIGAMRRVPASGEHRSNVHAGGSVEKHSLSKQELQLCRNIGPKLVADGLYFAGLDIINGKLIEVNVCSPGGITRINRLNRTRLQVQVIDFVESIVNAKELVISRKNDFRKAILDAQML